MSRDIVWLWDRGRRGSLIRVLAFGYDANIVSLNGSTSLNTLFEHSINLLNALTRERRRNAVSLLVLWVPVPIHNHLARSSYNLSCALTRRTDSKRCMDVKSHMLLFSPDCCP